jgi:hypothetical protein
MPSRAWGEPGPRGERGHKAGDADWLRALRNVKRWGRAVLPEEEGDLSIALVHTIDLYHEDFVTYRHTGEEDANVAHLTEAGRKRLGELEAACAKK